MSNSCSDRDCLCRRRQPDDVPCAAPAVPQLAFEVDEENVIRPVPKGATLADAHTLWQKIRRMLGV